MITIKKLTEILNYLADSLKTAISSIPKVTSDEEAEKTIRDETVSGFYNVQTYIKRYKHVKNSDGRRNPAGVYYFGNCGQTDENEIFQKAKDAVEKTFGKKENGILISVYERTDYVFYYVYHNGLNGFGKFSDYMIDAANKLKDLGNNGAVDGTIVDVFNDTLDDVADWLYKFRV